MSGSTESDGRLARIAVAAAGLYWLLLLVIMHMPLERETERLPRTPKHADKVVHVTAYGIFAVLLCWAADERRRLGAASAQRSSSSMPLTISVGVLLVLAVYGAVDEWTQPWTGRDGNISDYVGDVIGAALGVAAYTLLAGRRKSSAA